MGLAIIQFKILLALVIGGERLVVSMCEFPIGVGPWPTCPYMRVHVVIGFRVYRLYSAPKGTPI